MGNEFFGFSPDAFEQFARALCTHVFGPGMITFGDGPDGGREGIFRGTVPYPHPPAEQWSGYGVLQAKCKAKPEGTVKDQAWARKQLEKELKLFVTSAKRQPKPEYYIFITNVELSAGGGGWDECNALLESYRNDSKKLPTLKAHAVWSASQLHNYLNTFPDLRRSFTAYLTPGDVLAALIADIERRRPNVARILTTFLDRSLRFDEASRLQQAGDQTDNQMRLARLFVDLPAAVEPELTPPNEQLDEAGNLPAGVLEELLRVGSRKLSPLADERLGAGDGASRRAWPHMVLMLGGPGSGKSTIGQFLAQIHRAALLDRRDHSQLTNQTLQHVTEICRLCEGDRLTWPPTPRYPFRVELNRFAKALGVGGLTLSKYLRDQISANEDITHEVLLDWLRTYPWLLILDAGPARINCLVKSVLG